MLGQVEAELAEGKDLTPESIQQRCASVESITLESTIVEQEAAGFGDEQWRIVQQRSALATSSTNCRLAWTNRWRPGLRQGPLSSEEDARLIASAKKWGGHQVSEWWWLALLGLTLTSSEFNSFLGFAVEQSGA